MGKLSISSYSINDEHNSPIRLIIINVIQYRLFASFHDELMFMFYFID